MTTPLPRRFRARDLPAAVAAAWCARRRGGQVLVEAGGDGDLVAWAQRQHLPLHEVVALDGYEEPLTGPVPVDLPALPRHGLPPWPPSDDLAGQWDLLRNWLVTEGGPWMEVLPWAPEDAVWRVAAALPSEGCRVLWRLPEGTLLDSAWLALVADARIPLKIMVEATDLPAVVPAGWWVVVSGDPALISAALAQHLRDDMPLLLALGPAQPTTWPRSRAWEPGQGAG